MKINIKSLTEGTQVFEFKVDSSGLELDNQNFSIKFVDVKSSVSKNETNIYVNSRLNAELGFECDNCLNDFVYVLEDEFPVFYTSDSEAARHDDEKIIQFIESGTVEIDLTNGLRDSILLSIPIKAVCADDCKGLCPHCGVNLNEKSCNCKIQTIDPRWEGLKGLLDETPDFK